MCFVHVLPYSLKMEYSLARKAAIITLGQVKKTHVTRPDFYKKESGRAVFLLFIISYCMLSLHIIIFPQGYVGALISNINTTKHQILIKHKFV